MALLDVCFQEGEGQDFVVEVPTNSYSGSLTDIENESGGANFPVQEIPSPGRIFVISD